jgi:aryl-alcohol dehydrogenase-like predicted oxidoreductase
MEQRAFGKTSMRVSALGFGGAEIGFEHVSDVTELLARAIDSGVNVIDSAAAYLESERLIGRALGARRKDVYLFTKCGALDGFSRSDWSARGIRAALEQSLAALQTDYVDLLQLHSCSAEILRRGECITVLQDAKRDGLIRYMGYSGDGQDALVAIELGVFDSLQTSINVADQECLTLTLPQARQHGMGVIAKRPIANAAWRTGKLPKNSYHHTYYRRMVELDYPFVGEGVATSIATALRFTVFQPGVSTAIVGTTNPARFQENLAALAMGALPEGVEKAIQARWQDIAKSDWRGQV